MSSRVLQCNSCSGPPRQRMANEAASSSSTVTATATTTATTADKANEKADEGNDINIAIGVVSSILVVRCGAIALPCFARGVPMENPRPQTREAWSPSGHSSRSVRTGRSGRFGCSVRSRRSSRPGRFGRSRCIGAGPRGRGPRSWRFRFQEPDPLSDDASGMATIFASEHGAVAPAEIGYFLGRPLWQFPPLHPLRLFPPLQLHLGAGLRDCGLRSPGPVGSRGRPDL